MLAGSADDLERILTSSILISIMSMVNSFNNYKFNILQRGVVSQHAAL